MADYDDLYDDEDEPYYYDDEPQAPSVMDWVVLFKRAVIALGTLVVIVLGIITVIRGDVWVGLGIIFIGCPVWAFVADIATGLLAAVVIGPIVAARHLKRSRQAR